MSIDKRERGSKELTILVVVTHLGLLVSDAVTAGLNGVLCDLHFLLEGRTWDRSVNGEFVDTGFGTELRRRTREVRRVLDGAEAIAVFTLSNINGAQVGMAVGVDLDVSLGVLSWGRVMGSGCTGQPWKFNWRSGRSGCWGHHPRWLTRQEKARKKEASGQCCEHGRESCAGNLASQPRAKENPSLEDS